MLFPLKTTMGRRAKPSFGSEMSETELSVMLESGAAAVVLAAGRGDAFELSLKDLPDGPLRVRVTPVHSDGAVSVRFEVHGAGADFALCVTAAYSARDARPGLPGLSDDQWQNVRRIIEARGGGGEPCVFFSGSVQQRQPQTRIVAAIKGIAAKLLELGLATESTLAVVHVANRRSTLGTPMYTGSDVLVGTIGRIVKPFRPSTVTEGESVRLLFEGGAWAVGEDGGTFGWEIPVAGEQSITVQTAHADTHAGVVVKNDTIRLLLVHNALIHAEAMLRSTLWWDEPDVDRAMRLMRLSVKRNDEMAIFATLSFYSASRPPQQLRAAMRALYDLGLTAREPNTDAHVVVRHGERGNFRMETTSLLSLIWNVRPPDLRLRETGAPVTRAKKPRHTKGSEFGARNLLHVANRDPNVAGSIAHWHAVQRYLRLFAYANRMAAVSEAKAAEAERLNAHLTAEAARLKRRLWLIGIGEVAALGALGLAYYKHANRAKFGRPAHLYTD